MTIYMGVTSGARISYPSKEPGFNPGFSEVRIAQS